MSKVDIALDIAQDVQDGIIHTAGFHSAFGSVWGRGGGAGEKEEDSPLCLCQLLKQ